MDKKFLIKKWLDGELNEAELKAFKQLKEYESYKKLSETAQFFKAPEYATNQEYEKLNAQLKGRKSSLPKVKWLKPFTQIAAILVIGIGIYFAFFYNSVTVVNTLASKKTTIELPDASTVVLNTLSELSFEEKRWKNKRRVTLNGEAYFKVAKGSRFDVVTDAGTVSVLGTQFNVKKRENYFEVKCFEGLVGVMYNNTKTELPAGKTFRLMNGAVLKYVTDQLEPTWIHNKSSFKSVPFIQVVQELERQYSITVETQRVNTKQLFTGGFTHTDIDLALKSITLPLNFSYIKGKNKITLYKGEQNK